MTPQKRKKKKKKIGVIFLEELFDWLLKWLYHVIGQSETVNKNQ